MIGKLKTALLCCACAVMLGGCAHPELFDMGERSEQVLADLGEPHAKTGMPDGSVRWTYSGQPFGQDVWWLFFNSSGELIAREQGLQEKYFGMLEVGKSTEKDVWALWGRCAQEYTFHLVGEHAWMYRFKDFGGFDMAVWPQFGPDGVLRSLEVTEDPWKNRDSDNFLNF